MHYPDLAQAKHSGTIRDIINSIQKISESSFKAIENNVEYESYEQGQMFISKDKFNNKEYFLLKGICKSYLLSQEGEEITLSFFNEKSVISPHIIRTRNQVSVVNLKCLVDVELAVLDAIKFAELMTSNIEIRNFGNQVLKNELIDKIEKEIGLASLTAKQRLLSFRKTPFIREFNPSAKGLPAIAKVISIIDTKTTINNDPVLRLSLKVYPQNEPAFESEAQKLISRIEIHKLQPGIFLQVKYNPKSHDVAIVSIEALNVDTTVEEGTT